MILYDLSYYIRIYHTRPGDRFAYLWKSAGDQVLRVGLWDPRRDQRAGPVSPLFDVTIQDPQNLGAIIRNAVCFGCAGIVLPKRRSAGISPGAMKASSGALAHCPVAQIANLGVAVERLKEKGFIIYGADASPESESLSQARFDFPLGLMLGNEFQGIMPTLKKSCDKLIHIPQESRVASLNVSSASAILLYSLTRPR